ncbi:MAG: hypothetical protein WCY77_10050 [Weeksellaceae bacterium]
MGSISNNMDVNKMVKIIKDNGYIVVPEFISYAQKWEIVVIPWDFIRSKKRPGKIKRTGHFFNKNECSTQLGKETQFAKKMKEVQLKLVQHFTRKTTKTE